MGNGKSTSGNAIMKEEIRKQKGRFRGQNKFESGRSTKAVTTKSLIKNLKEMSIMDTPGLNDPDQKRSDAQNFINIVKNMQSEKMKSRGISTLLQCIMVPESGRIMKSAIENLSKIL